jgi:hypothetical protein
MCPDGSLVKNRRVNESLWVSAILILFLLVAFYDVVFLGKTFKITTANPQALFTGPYGQQHNRPAFFPIHTTDVSLNEEPILEFIKQSFRKGIVPLWNPHLGCGYPLIGMIQNGMFWPLNLFLYVFPQKYGWDLLIFARFFCAGLFTYLFMRTLHYGKIPALGSALCYMLGIPMVLLQAWMANVDILTPLVLLVHERFVQRPDRRRAGHLALGVAATFFAGHPEHILLTNALGFLYFCFRLVTTQERSSWLKSLVRLWGTYLLAFGLSSVVLLPFIYNFLTEFWHSHPLETGTWVEAVFVRNPITMLIPQFFQREPVTLKFHIAGWWGRIGILPVFLGVFCLFSRQKKYLNYFFFVMLFLVFGKNFLDSPLTNWIGTLPLFRYVRFVFHSAHLLGFLVSVMAGMGIRLVLARKSLFLKGLVLSVALLSAAVYCLRSYPRDASYRVSCEEITFSAVVAAAFLGVLLLSKRKFVKRSWIGIILVLLIFIELYHYIPRGRVNRLDSFPEVPYIEFLKNQTPRSRNYGIFWTLYPNTAAGYGIDDLGIYEGLLSKRFVNFVNYFLSPNYFQKGAGSMTSALWVVPFSFLEAKRPYFDLLNVRYTVAPTNVVSFLRKLPTENYTAGNPAYDAEVKLYERPSVFPRVFIVHRVVFEKDEQRALKRIEELRNFLRIIAIIQHE